MPPTRLKAFGTAGAVVNVLVGDQTLVPAAFELDLNIDRPPFAVRPPRLYGLVTPVTMIQVLAPRDWIVQVEPGGGAMRAVIRRGGPGHIDAAAEAG